MNWFKKAQGFQFELSLSGLKNLLQTLQNRTPEHPSQQYLIQGPEISELQFLRSIDTETVSKIHKMIKYLCETFENLAYMKDDASDSAIDESEIENEIDERLYMYLEDFNWKNQDNDDVIGFMDGLEEKDIEELSLQIIENLVRDVPSPEEFSTIFSQMVEFKEGMMASGYDDESSLNESLKSIKQFYDELTLEDPELITNSDLTDFINAISEYTAECINYILHVNTNPGQYNQSEVPSWESPTWINFELLKEYLNDIFESETEEWYKNENKYSLSQAASESIYENRYEYYREKSRELEHEYGFKVVETLSSDPDFDYNTILNENLDEWKDEPRLDINLNDLCDIISTLYSSYDIERADTAALDALPFASAALVIADSDESLNRIFNQTVNSVKIDPSQLSTSLEHNLRLNQEIPEELNTPEIERMREQFEQLREAEESERQRREIEIETQRQLHQMELTRQQEAKEKYHTMLSPNVVSPTKEEIEKGKEMGLYKKPFPYAYTLQRERFPGAGFSKMPKYLEPFKISVSPLVEEKIPSQLMEEMSLHTVSPTQGAKPLGWIGGYADYADKIMYVMEVQSDIMQRTVHMRDPKKAKQQQKQEIERLKQQISKLQQSKLQAVSPKQQLIQKLDRIRIENEQLDPSSEKYQKNQQLVDRLLSQLPKVPDVIDTSQADQNIQQMQQQLDFLLKSVGKTRDFKEEGGYYKDFSHWHEYRSKIENMFKDWIAIFFNVAFREAKSRGFEKVRIISAESLLELWAEYAKKNTGILFKRIYDNIAKNFGSKEIEKYDKKWFELNTQEIATASTHSWFKKIY